ncbi:TPA: hypothetical protein ACIZBI_003142 [Legionella pneumophila]|uniref:Uncharacterized protein n=2 Tax=Legionellaceae TaxID=444 RepID=A0A377GAY1_9GAMM|nr:MULTISPECIES: hypothetical protein [Legionellaceae]HAT8876805.1 hypothetical protein [Legionella pneumophila subsp. pneumophila]KTC90420.1 hypothetical protein Ldum_1488 [Fluoribacter dumoffii NY 23]KTD68974.1 hypothetical protein Lste_2132 [Legionella steelei]MCW8483236.1 RAQPRD family integrative conjugative element protein [Fluoribacter dumoffii]STO21975.1 Uncharacterised protein [Fluoribacter dumoffii]
MKRLLLLLILSLPMASHASDDALNQTLVRIINQINAIMPLLDEAKTEIEPNTRIQLHIEHFEGSDGKTHPGLRTDLLSIRNALIDYINKPAIEPKTIKPLALDFIGK